MKHHRGAAGIVVALSLLVPAARAHASGARPILERDWVLVNTPVHPPASDAMVYDSVHDETVLVVPDHPSQTWVFNGSTRTWHKKSPATNPSMRRATLAFDHARGRVVILADLQNPPPRCTTIPVVQT